MVIHSGNNNVITVKTPWERKEVLEATWKLFKVHWENELGAMQNCHYILTWPKDLQLTPEFSLKHLQPTQQYKLALRIFGILIRICIIT